MGPPPLKQEAAFRLTNLNTYQKLQLKYFSFQKSDIRGMENNQSAGPITAVSPCTISQFKVTKIHQIGNIQPDVIQIQSQSNHPNRQIITTWSVSIVKFRLHYVKAAKTEKKKKVKKRCKKNKITNPGYIYIEATG